MRSAARKSAPARPRERTKTCGSVHPNSASAARAAAAVPPAPKTAADLMGEVRPAVLNAATIPYTSVLAPISIRLPPLYWQVTVLTAPTTAEGGSIDHREIR